LGFLVTLPLWTPSQVALGAVGYLSKPGGEFVTLFNSFDPAKSSDGVARNMPSLYGYGRVTQGNQRQDKRSVAQRGLDAISGLLTFKKQDDGSFS
jgi:abelson tyrosine-protein kinase 1